MAKKKSGPIVKKGLDDWMATYADMVTLLFCFFVMLYSASNQDESKFQYILQSMSTTGRYINTIVGRELEPPSPHGNQNTDIPPQTPGDLEGSNPGQTNQPHLFDSLFQNLTEVVEKEGFEGVHIFSRPGQIRIQLDNDVLFDGNSYSLKASGRHVLDLISPSIFSAREWIQSVQVQGHTANIGTWGLDDWELSSMRAVSVVGHLDGMYFGNVRGMVQSEKFRTEGFGQYHPIADNDSDAGRARNRRVEIIINRVDLPEEENRFVDDIMKYDYNNPIFDVDAVGGAIQEPGRPVESRVAAILGDLVEKYGDANDPFAPPRPPSGGGTQVGPNPGGFTNIGDSDFVPPDANGQLTIDNGQLPEDNDE